MKGKRGQITLLVIVGIILLISVSIILYMQNLSVNAQLQAQADASINDFLELNSINYYVGSCLDKVAAEGLTLLMEQGGVIYDYQGGLSDTSYFLEGRHYMPYNFTYQIINETGDTINKSYIRNVSYVIQDTVFCPKSFIQPMIANFSDETTSYYPVNRTYLEEYTTRYNKPYFLNSNFGCGSLSPRISISGYFGLNKLPKLCSYNGSNAGENAAENSCLTTQFDSVQEPTSIQRQLETYVKNNLGNCINFTHYTEISQYNITVEQEKVSVQTILQDPKGLVVRAKYPFNIAVENKAPIIRQVDFQTTIDINLRTLYQYIERTIRNLVWNPEFVQKNNFSNNPFYRDSFRVEIEEHACEHTCESPRNFADDIIQFTDHSPTAKLRGLSTTFSFALRQRKPALDYLHDSSQTNFFNGRPINYMYYTNASITIQPYAIDPNNDNITYNYSGWKETHEEIFNYSGCRQAQQDRTNCLEEPFDCMGITCNDNGCPGCNLSNHLSYMAYDTSLAPHNWTLSEQFQNTNRTAQYQTNESDVGYHEVIVSVMDEHGAQDFQIVRYLIFDLPIARLQGNNSYDDVNDSYASIEDIYYLNGSTSQASVLGGGELSSFIYRDDDEISTYYPTGFVNITDQSWITLPVMNYSFSNITSGVFSEESLGEETSELRTPYLIVGQDTGTGIIYSAASYVDVHLSQCLLHGYDNETGYQQPNLATDGARKYHWGLGETDEDLFNAPHVCCRPEHPEIPANQTGGGFYYPSTYPCLQIFNKPTCYPLDGDYVYLKRSLIDENSSSILRMNKTNYERVREGGNYFNDFFPEGYDSDLSEATNKDYFNDVFNLSMKQTCSGFRGNSCGGEFETVSWAGTSCNDLNDVGAINQYARCQAPSKDFNDCVGHNVNAELSCENMSRGETFEGTWIENNVIRAEIISDEDEREKAEQGFCADGVRVILEPLEDWKYVGVSKNNAGEYLCDGTCSSETGICGYEDLHGLCECKPGNICEGKLANELFEVAGDDVFGTFGKAKFVCLDDDRACSYDCGVKSKTESKEGCYCQVDPADGDETYDYLENQFEHFFDQGGYNHFNTCCVGNEIIQATNQHNQEFYKVCYKGKVYIDGDRFRKDEGIPLLNLLSCDGNIIRCCRWNEACEIETLSGNAYFGELCQRSCNSNFGNWI